VKIALSTAGRRHVLDASRVVDVVSSLLNDKLRPTSSGATANCRISCAIIQRAPRAAAVPYDVALRNRSRSIGDETLPAPSFVAGELLARCPSSRSCHTSTGRSFSRLGAQRPVSAILEHPRYGRAARDLYDNGGTARVGSSASSCARRTALWILPAASEDDDIVVYRDREKTGELVRFNMLRQQEAIADGKPNLSLADFIAPRARERPTIWVRSPSRPVWRGNAARASIRGATKTTMPSS